MTTSAEPIDTPGRQTRFGLVFVLWLAGLTAAAQFGKFSVLYDDLLPAFGATRMGLAVSIVGLVGLIFGAMAGMFVGRLGYRRVLVGALALGAALSAVQAIGLGYGALMVTRVLEGFSHLGIVVAAPVLIARVSAPRHFGATLSLWSSFFGVSYALMAWGGQAIVDLLGQPALFLVHAAAMAVVSLTLEQMIDAREEGGNQDPAGAAAPGIIARHKALYASPFVAAPALGFVFYTASYVALLTIVPTMFAPGARGLVAAAMPLVSIAVSLTLGIWLLARHPAVRLVQAGFAAGAVAALALWLSWAHVGAAMAAVLVLSGALGLVQGASFATIPALNPGAEDRARAAGAIAQLGNLGTTSGTPILAAMVIWGGIEGLLLFVLPLMLGGCLMVEWLARRRARQLIPR